MEIVNDRDLQLIRGSGNIFRDFGDPDADEKQTKAVVAAGVIRLLDEFKLSVRRAARITGLDVSDLNDVCNADLRGITVERLQEMFEVLEDYGVDAGALQTQAALKSEDPTPGP